MKLDDEPVHITIDEAVSALSASAFDDYDYDDDDNPVPNGNKRIHTVTDGPVMIGADWDLSGAIAFAERSVDRAWAGHPMSHELAVCADGRIIRFDCKRPKPAPVTLPEVLLSAAAELRDAQAAWSHVTAAADETSLMQYVGETEYAVKRCAALLDEWLTVGQCYSAGSYVPDGEGPF